jgi:hypothetical protein
VIAAKVVDILLEARSFQDYWVDPDGKMHPCDDHDSFAMEWLDYLAIRPPEDPDHDWAYQQMYAKGWVRCVERDETIYLSGRLPSRVQLASVRDYAIDAKKEVVYDNGHGWGSSRQRVLFDPNWA